MAEPVEAKLSTLNFHFSIINIMVYDSYVKNRRFSTKKRWLSLAKPKFQLSTINFQLIDIMVYDSYIKKIRFSTKKMLAEPVEAKFSTLNFQLINIMVYDSYGKNQQKNKL